MQHLCVRRRISPVGNCCAVRVGACSIIPPRLRQANAAPRAKMATVLLATTKARMGCLRPIGKAKRATVILFEEMNVLQSVEYPLPEQGKTSSAITLSFNEFELGHMAFNHSIVDRKGKASPHRFFVLLDASSKRV